MAYFHFKTREECDAFTRLLSGLSRFQEWEQGHTAPDGTQCHVCNETLGVKQGRVSYNDFFESKHLEGYTYWNLCSSCRTKGWNLPIFCVKRSIEYWRTGCKRADCKSEKLVIENCPIFIYPTLVGVNTKSLLVSVGEEPA